MTSGKPINQRWLIFALLLAGAILRLMWHFEWSGLSIGRSPALDEALHLEWIKLLADGRTSPEIPYFRAPLFAWLFGALGRLGLDLAGMRVFSSLLGMVNMLLLLRLGRKEGRQGGLAWLAALAAFSGSWIYYGPQILLAHLFVLTLLVAAILMRRTLEDQEKPAGRRWLWPLLAGLFTGLACITRPQALLLLPLLPLLPLMMRQPAWLKRGLAMLAGSLLPVLLVATINGWPASGVLIASQGGVNFWIGNNAQADGRSPSLPGTGPAWTREDATAVATLGLGQVPGPGEESAYFYGQAINWMKANPAEALKLIWFKFELILAPPEWGNNTNPLALSARVPWMNGLLKVGWWFILLPALAGLALGLPRSRSLMLILLPMVLMQTAVMVLFFVNIRFRMPLAVLLMIPAAEFYSCAWLRLRDTWKRYIAGDTGDTVDPDCLPPLNAGRFVLLFALLVLPVYSWNHIRDTLPENLSIKQQAWTDFQLGNGHLRLGEVEAAKACFLASLAADSTQQEVRLNLGLLAGSPAEAASWFQAELTLDPQSAKAWNNLGSLALDQGNLPEAIRCFDRALQLRPGLIDASWNLGLALCASGLKAAQAGRLDLAGMLLLKARDTSYDGDALQSLEARIAGGDE